MNQINRAVAAALLERLRTQGLISGELYTGAMDRLHAPGKEEEHGSAENPQ